VQPESVGLDNRRGIKHQFDAVESFDVFEPVDVQPFFDIEVNEYLVEAAMPRGPVDRGASFVFTKSVFAPARRRAPGL
jgi:hypothetical protein